MSEIKVGRGFISLGSCNKHTIIINVDMIREVYVEEVEVVPATYSGNVITKEAVKEMKTVVYFTNGEHRWSFNIKSFPPEKFFEAITQAKLSPTEQLDARLQGKDL